MERKDRINKILNEENIPLTDEIIENSEVLRTFCLIKYRNKKYFLLFF